MQDIKNIALLYSEDLKGIRLAPAYDLLSTVIYDSSTEKMSLNIDGEYDIRNINQKSFENEAKKLVSLKYNGRKLYVFI